MAKVVTGMGNFPGLVAHPSNILFDVVNVLLIFFDWICVIVSQIAMSV